jgi:Anaerobic dehydrogenases, typically selenocysteine-containing
MLTRKGFLTGLAAGSGGLAATRLLTNGGASQAESATGASAPVEEWIPTACWIGKQDCGMLARRIDGRVVKFEGNPAHPRNAGTLCPKGMAQIIALYDPNRLKAPLVRTNEKGVPGRWRQASWEEALQLVGDKIRKVRDRDPARLLFLVGRSKSKAFYDEAFVKATGATKLDHGAVSTGAGERASQYTIGLQGGLHPDFRNTRYLLAWGWNLTNAGGNKLCWIAWNRQLLEAKDRGMKVVVIDPRLRGAGPFADEWLPIRPGSDLALALALCNVLIAEGHVDRPYLTRYTNAPFLVGEDGHFLRSDGSEQVWDRAAGRAEPAGATGVEPALEGEYEVGGRKARPAFQLFKEHVVQYTPEWAAEICGVPADQIRRVGSELGENASIGDHTHTAEGTKLPHRPVSAMAAHVSQQELGFQAFRAVLAAFMLVGAVGASGGLFMDFTWKIDGRFEEDDRADIKDPPYDVDLKQSKFFPINSGSFAIAAKVMLDPAKYGVEQIPEAAIVHMTNPIVSYPDQRVIREALTKLEFVAVVSPWLSETADHFADVVLPSATIEKYEGPLPATDQYADAVALRIPPMPPLFQSRGEADIYLDLCEQAGILYGEGGYLAELSKALGLQGRYALPLGRKPTVRHIFDRWARSQGIKEGIAYFEKHGVRVKGAVSDKDYYGYLTEPPFGGVRHRLYGESLLRYREQMKAKGADEVYWRDYTPLPTWRKPTMDSSPPEYDLYLISFKMIEFKQSRASFIPLLAEMAPEQRLVMNSRAAEARGVGDGDEVWVESHNAVTGETRRLKVKVDCTEAIRPDTVGMPHHYGLWTHPLAKGQGPTPNEIFYTGEGYVANTADQSFHVKVRVLKA